MKKMQKIVAAFLILAMLFTESGFSVAAAGEPELSQGTEVSAENTADSGQQNLEEAGQEQTAAETVEGAGADPVSETPETEKIQEETAGNPESVFSYVYVDEATVNVPETQNIAAAFTDTAVRAESATLHAISETTGEKFDIPASVIVENTVLFTKEYSEGMTDSVSLTGITYVSAGQEIYADFLQEEIEASYLVTEEPEAETAETEASGVNVYSLDESGEILEEASGSVDEIEETVEGAVDQAVPEITTFSGARTGNKVIVLCAGHDATHVGARGNGLKEEELTFKVAQYAKQALEQYSGVTVYLDRESVNCAYPGQSTSYCLNQRVKDAAAKGASVFVDIHFNTGGGTGAEVYYPNKSYNESISQDGKNLAEKILEQLTALGLPNRGAKIRNGTTGETDPAGNVDDYYTTNYLAKQYGMTGIIVEHAFLDHASDAAKLKDENFIRQLGEADARGIANAYGLTEGSNEPTVEPAVEIVNENDFEGTAQIAVSGVGEGANVAVWKSGEQENTIKWYTVTGKEGVIDFNIRNHNNVRGTYKVDVYDPTGREFLCGTSFDVSADPSSIIQANSDGTEKIFKIKLKFNDMPDEVSSIRFPVWHAADQSDIRWYEAAQTSAGTWEADVKISDYKVTGIYNVHAYAILKSGTMILVNSTAFQVSKPEASVKVQTYDIEKGTFEVSISDVRSASGIESVQVPVWTSKNGQDDLIWHQAEKQTDGSYRAVISVADHGYETGTYIIHTYVICGNGVEENVSQDTIEAEAPSTYVTATNADGTEMCYQLRVGNLAQYRNATSVSFATWSVENGQDDLVWYAGSKASEGVWKAEANIANHKTAGKYEVHVYGVVNGVQILLGTTEFEVSAPSADVQIENYNEEQGTFDVLIRDAAAKSGVKEIQVPVWCKDDQSDIFWYRAARQSDGSYKVTVKASNHGYSTGTYKIHTYVNCENGVQQIVSGKEQKIVAPGVYVSAENTDKKENRYQLTVGNLGWYGNLTSVSFATWSEKNTQDDLIWYTGNKASEGVWRAEVSIVNHRTAGKYEVHAYGVVNGQQVFLGNTTFYVSEPSAEVEITNYNESQGSFDVIIRNVVSKSEVKEIEVPVWCKDDQSDIRWNVAEKQQDGSYKVSVKASDYGYSTGVYKIHTYVICENGVQSLVSGKEQNVTAPGVYVNVRDKADSGNNNRPGEGTEVTGNRETNYELQIGNLGWYGTVEEVSFAVWSETGGQDDLVWYSGKQEAEGTWKTELNIRDHKTPGKYFVQVYGTVSGQQTFLGGAEFEVSKPSAVVNVVNYDPKRGSFDVVIQNIVSNSGIEEIKVPVWCKDDQSDIQWYTANKQTDGSYKVTVKTANHGGHAGVYKIHTYIICGNGIQELVSGITQEVEKSASYEIMGTTQTNVEQMVRYFESSGRTYPSKELAKGGASSIREFCQIYYEEAAAEGVKAEVAFAQAMKETGWLQFGGIVKVEQFNFAGLGALDGNSTGQAASFPDVRTGVRAQIQHLKAYGSDKALNNACVDPRFHLVKRNSAPYVEWLGIQENPNGTGWASASNYGYDIIDMIKVLLNK